MTPDEYQLYDIPEIDSDLYVELASSGYYTVADVAEAGSEEDFSGIDGFDSWHYAAVVTKYVDLRVEGLDTHAIQLEVIE